ncbi:hypothetical protein KIN20_032025 [Parelaphostrongylus tenuis]|uniref:Uncharacterized protein n=1 Tax=Parelaphostrongylus tenuis TaxID=148309 RepID=A0AAD5WI67_PARTN|nr:hypothetical protein KIN20_032025 [Parelaphostrongylus tenuis]
MIRLISGVHLSMVLCTDEKIFTVEPLHNSQNRRQLFKKGQVKFALAKAMSKSTHSLFGLCDALGRHLRHRKNTDDLHQLNGDVRIIVAGYEQQVLRGILEPWAT